MPNDILHKHVMKCRVMSLKPCEITWMSASVLKWISKDWIIFLDVLERLKIHQIVECYLIIFTLSHEQATVEREFSNNNEL